MADPDDEDSDADTPIYVPVNPKQSSPARLCIAFAQRTALRAGAPHF